MSPDNLLQFGQTNLTSKVRTGPGESAKTRVAIMKAKHLMQASLGRSRCSWTWARAGQMKIMYNSSATPGWKKSQINGRIELAKHTLRKSVLSSHGFRIGGQEDCSKTCVFPWFTFRAFFEMYLKNSSCFYIQDKLIKRGSIVQMLFEPHEFCSLKGVVQLQNKCSW